ncbi:MAG: hypothetical protein ACLFS0_06350, partial [Bacteroidales bacterium]
VSIIGEEGTVIKPSLIDKAKVSLSQIIWVDNLPDKLSKTESMNVVLEGLIIDGENVQGTAYGIRANTGKTPIDITISDNEIRHIQSEGNCYGIYVASVVSATIAGNKVHEIESLPDYNKWISGRAYGIYTENIGHLEIRNNELSGILSSDGDAYAIHVQGTGGEFGKTIPDTEIIISDNDITDVENAIYVRSVPDLLIEENHVVFESIVGIAIDIGSMDMRKSGNDLTKSSEGMAEREKISGQKLTPPDWTWTLIGNKLSGLVSERSVPDKKMEPSGGMILSGNIFDLSGPDIEVNARDNIVREFSQGIVALGDDYLTVNVHHNVINGNEEGVISMCFGSPDKSEVPPVVNATNNWWGDPSGPGGEGPGSGDSVSEDVAYSPWLGNEPGSQDATQYIVDQSGSVQDAVDDARNRGGSGHRITFQGLFTDGLDASGSGVILSPGSSPGHASFTGDFSMGATETLEVDIDGPDPGTGYDQIAVSGDINLGGAALLVNLGFSPELGDQFTILQGEGSIDNEFSAGGTITATNGGFRYMFSISYPDATKGSPSYNNEVVLTVEDIQSNAVATPLGLWSLLLAAGLTMTFLIRRKQ